ncbi:MAG: hypothetical protein ACRDNJ_15975 [Solirubrobacteraceae bacterium]
MSIVTVGAGGSGASSYNTSLLAQLSSDPAVGVSSGRTDTSTTTPLLVTDQVGSVTATYRAQSYPGRVHRTFSVTKRPVRNLVMFRLSGAWDPPQLTFRSTTGAVIAQTRRH